MEVLGVSPDRRFIFSDRAFNLSDLSIEGTCDILVYQAFHKVMILYQMFHKVMIVFKNFDWQKSKPVEKNHKLWSSVEENNLF